MFREAVYLPECVDEFLNISQILNVQKSLHRCLFHTILYLPMPTEQQEDCVCN